MTHRVVDISSHIGKKIDAIVECKPRGDGNRGFLARAQLARQGKRLPLLGNDDRTADRAYVRQFLLDDDRESAKQYKIEFAERFYYIDQRQPAKSKADECAHLMQAGPRPGRALGRVSFRLALEHQLQAELDLARGARRFGNQSRLS